MIRRPYQEGYLLIPQPAHAWLSGQLAQHWGNSGVASRPEPYQSVVIGTTMHDVGWLEKDGSPILNADNQPLHFIEPELDSVEGMYGRCVSNTMQVDPYAGVLVNRHIQTIYHSRATHKRDKMERLQPLLDALKNQELHTIQQMQTHPVYQDYIDEPHLNHNYRILRTCDLLSLFVCGAFPARTIPDVPFHYDEAFGELTCELLDEHTLKVTPAIFNQSEITVYLQAKIIPKQYFESQADYNEVFEKADSITLRKTIVSSVSTR